MRSIWCHVHTMKSTLPPLPVLLHIIISVLRSNCFFNILLARPAWAQICHFIETWCLYVFTYMYHGIAGSLPLLSDWLASKMSVGCDCWFPRSEFSSRMQIMSCLVPESAIYSASASSLENGLSSTCLISYVQSNGQSLCGCAEHFYQGTCGQWFLLPSRKHILQSGSVGAEGAVDDDEDMPDKDGFYTFTVRAPLYWPASTVTADVTE